MGIAALGGGWLLMMDPTGETLGISIELLKETFFNNYSIPGIILFTFNGLLSLFAMFLGLQKSIKYAFFLIVQGGILFCWLTIELIINLDFYAHHLHIPLYLMSFIVAGIKLKNDRELKKDKIN